MRPTVLPAKACWPKQLQRINYASLAKTKAHMCGISVSHTHMHTDALVCVRSFQSSFGTFICISSKLAEQNCCMRWLRLSSVGGLPGARPLWAKRNMQMPHKCAAAAVQWHSPSSKQPPPPQPLCLPLSFPEAFYLPFRMRSSVKQTYNKL